MYLFNGNLFCIGVTYLVGRADDEDKMVKKADIYLTNHDPTFSRRHAKITVVKKENSGKVY